ncbi:MAG: hemerythrin domain-containing protein [Proteobacteria bacterium]|nr:hemerythrin domain-containing protein [Pseudomonadota bacterium]
MRVDLYTNPHKEQREWLYQVAIQAGKADIAHKEAFDELFSNFTELLKDLHQHVRAEEAFVHPLYLAKNLFMADPLHADHEILELSLQDLSLQMQKMKREDSGEKRAELGLFFYRSFNRFISQYLEHIDAEERMLPFLWEAYSDEQLMLCILTYKASIGSDEGLIKIVSAFESIDKSSQQRLFKGFKQNASSERFGQFCTQLKVALPPNGYQDLTSSLL